MRSFYALTALAAVQAARVCATPAATTPVATPSVPASVPASTATPATPTTPPADPPAAPPPATGTLSQVQCAPTVDLTEGLPDSGLDTSKWTPGVKPDIKDLFNLHDFQIGVKNFLGKTEYGYIRTGVLDEYTYQANLNIWKNVKLRAHLFEGRNVQNVSIETEIFGNKFAAPFFLAPAAYSGFTDPEGAECNLVQAAAKAGILYAPSIVSTKTTAEIAASRAPGQVLFRQIYPRANETKFFEQLAEAESLGFKTAFVTIDNPTQQGLRTRSLRFSGPDSSGDYSPDRSLETIMGYQAKTNLTLIPKGIMNWQDAKKAMDLGFKALYISNHGGRLLDTAQTSVENLLEIRKYAPEVLQKMEVYADSGVRHGSDIIKLLALGAKAVGVGRPAVWANAWGVDGVTKMINLLQMEFTTTLKLLGVNDITQLDETYINTKIVESWLF